MTKPYVRLMLDSGAFSAWRQGKPIILKEYIDYIKRNQKYLQSYVNLDVIPSGRSPKLLEAAAQASFDNLQEMHAAGLKPIPVYHYGERLEWLEKLLDAGERYIGLGGVAIAATKGHRRSVLNWLDSCFSIMTDAKGHPIVKTHGFGITSNQICQRYPWFTVDSTTWITYANYGHLYVPVYVNGKPDYSRTPMQFHISHRPTKPGSHTKLSFDNLSTQAQDVIVKFLTEEVGVTLTEIRNSPVYRQRVQIAYCKELESRCNTFTFEARNKKLLLPKPNGLSPYKPWSMQIMYGTAVAIQHSTSLNMFDIRNRLLSYFELKQHSDETLKYYVETGMPHDREVTPQRTNWKREAYLVRRRLQVARRHLDATHRPIRKVEPSLPRVK